jgi:predicted Zn-dependent protease
MYSSQQELEMHKLKLAVTGLLLAGFAGTLSSPIQAAKLQLVSDKQMSEMGVKAFEEMKTKGKLSQDPKKREIAECIVTSLVAPLGQQLGPNGWEVQVFESPEPNAFALPGGKVGIHTGMFDLVKSQDELAAVVGHEIAHVARSHSKKRVERQLKTQLGLSLLGAIAGSKTSENNTRMITQGAGLLTQGAYLLPNSREQEVQADLDGQIIMSRAGYDPMGAVSLWQKMQALNKAQPPQFLSTHPNSEQRINTLTQQAPALVKDQNAARAAGRKPKCM